MLWRFAQEKGYLTINMDEGEYLICSVASSVLCCFIFSFFVEFSTAICLSLLLGDFFSILILLPIFLVHNYRSRK